MSSCCTGCALAAYAHGADSGQVVNGILYNLFWKFWDARIDQRAEGVYKDSTEDETVRNELQLP